jgi:hypothetical protein
MQCNAMQCNAMQCNAIQCNAHIRCFRDSYTHALEHCGHYHHTSSLPCVSLQDTGGFFVAVFEKVSELPPSYCLPHSMRTEKGKEVEGTRGGAEDEVVAGTSVLSLSE